MREPALPPAQGGRAQVAQAQPPNPERHSMKELEPRSEPAPPIQSDPAEEPA